MNGNGQKRQLVCVCVGERKERHRVGAKENMYMCETGMKRDRNGVISVIKRERKEDRDRKTDIQTNRVVYVR